MKIKLRTAPPVGPEHGLTRGRVLETTLPPNGHYEGVWVVGDQGEKVRVFAREYEIIKEEEDESNQQQRG